MDDRIELDSKGKPVGRGWSGAALAEPLGDVPVQIQPVGGGPQPLQHNVCSRTNPTPRHWNLAAAVEAASRSEVVAPEQGDRLSQSS